MFAHRISSERNDEKRFSIIENARTSALSIDASAWVFRIKAESLSREFAPTWRNFAYARL